MRQTDLTPELVRELLDYDPETGIFRWKPRPASMFQSPATGKTWNKRFAGKVVGRNEDKGNGYRRIVFCVMNKERLAHRLAWMWVTGEQPPAEIDHINRDSTDNRWANLRDGTRVNKLNRNQQKNCTSGFTGVSWHGRDRKWRAQTRLDGKRYRLGTFKDIEDAARAVAEFHREHGFSPDHGKPRIAQ